MWNRRRWLHVTGAMAVSFGLGPVAHGQGGQDGQGGNKGGNQGGNQGDPALSTGKLWREGDPGERLHLRGRVVSTDGRPVAGAAISFRQADGTGSYPENRYRARLVTAEDGAFQVLTVLPGQYWGAKHIHVTLVHPAYVPLDTRILFRGDPNIDETEGDLAIPLEEVRTEQGTVLMGGVEFVLEPNASR